MASTLQRDSMAWSSWPVAPSQGGGSGGTGVPEVFQSEVDPNGLIVATAPAMCYASDGRIWIKINSGVNSTGWALDIG